VKDSLFKKFRMNSAISIFRKKMPNSIVGCVLGWFVNEREMDVGAVGDRSVWPRIGLALVMRFGHVRFRLRLRA
jgi:hypothetical protein